MQEQPRLLPGRLHSLSLKRPDAEPAQVGEDLVRLLERIIVLRVFFTRVTNQDVQDLPHVDRFFREVVTPVIQSLGYAPYEVGRSSSSEALIHREIFEQIHYAAGVVADLTASRPNNFIELGYALGQSRRVVVTAKKGAEIPFNVALPVHLWTLETPIEERRRQFEEFWLLNVKRPPIVTPREII